MLTLFTNVLSIVGAVDGVVARLRSRRPAPDRPPLKRVTERHDSPSSRPLRR